MSASSSEGKRMRAWSWVGVLLLAGCQVVAPTVQVGDEAPAVARGTLAVQVQWPARTTQVIPLSAQTIRVKVLQGATVLETVNLSRPVDDGGPLVASANLQLDAASGLSVTAAAYRTSPVGVSDVAIAEASATGVTVVANQRTPVSLIMGAAFVPTLVGFSPANGGPGVPVTLTGSFGTSGYYGLRLGTRTSYGALSGGAIVTAVPTGAETGPVVAIADGVPSSASSVFRVLKELGLLPRTATTSVGGQLAFSVPTATDTAAVAVPSPTITQWAVVDPLMADMPPEQALSGVGTITGSGTFTAAAPGQAWIRAWSGALSATAAVSVE